MSLDGRRALVTGGGSGIGAACAAALAGAGAEVVLVGRDLARLEATAARMGGRIGVRAIACDVTDEGAVKRAFAEAGPVSILVNNAGAAVTAPFARVTRAAFEAALAVNLTGAFLCAQAASPGMTAAGWGRIVNVASTAGLRGYRYVAPYVAAKHGLVGLTRAMALELARDGVTVNAVCPGFTDTDIVAAGARTLVERTGRSEVEARAVFEAANPQGRLVQPEEVAALVLHLCGEGAGAINGAVLAVDGGETAG